MSRVIGPPEVPETVAEGGSGTGDLHTLARGGTLAVLGGVLNGILGFLLVVVVSRALGPVGSGLFFEAVGIFTILTIAAEFGASAGMVRSVARFRALERVEDLRGVFLAGLGPVLLASVVLGAALFVLADPLASVFMGAAHGDIGAGYLRLLAPFLPASAVVTVALAGTRALGTMVPFVTLEHVGKPLVRVVLAAGVAGLGLSATALVLAWAVPVALFVPAVLLTTVTLVRRAERTAERRGTGLGLRQGRRLVGEFWRFAAPRGLASVFQVGILWLDVLLVGSIRGPREAGIYVAASRFVMIGIMVLEAARMAIAPQLSALLARGKHDRAEGVYRVATWWSMVISWPFYLLVVVFAPAILGLFGPGFAEGATALVILSLAMLVNLATGNVTVVLLMSGRSWWNLLNTVLAIALNVVLNLLLIPRIGIEGAALAWAISILFENLVPLLQVGLILRMHPFGRGYLLVTSIAIGCFGLLSWLVRSLMGDTLLAVALAGTFGLALYVSLLTASRKTLRLPELWSAIRGGDAAVSPVGEGNGGVRSDGGGRTARTAVTGIAKRALRTYGIVSSSRRVLPDFLIIGAKRGGTTSLWNYIATHPDVAPLFPPAQKIKGVHYFDTHHHRGPAWYRSHFPTEGWLERAQREHGVRPRVGEASPYYLAHPLAAERAAALVPGARLIVLLRNPADRAYSHYRERVRHGAETLAFSEAIAREDERVEGEVARILQDDGYASAAHEHHSYVAQGQYADALTPWLARFPRESFLFLLSEDFYGSTVDTYRRVQVFLDLRHHELETFDRYNYHPGSEMEPEDRARLRSHFEPYNRRLADLLGLDLSRWEG